MDTVERIVWKSIHDRESSAVTMSRDSRPLLIRTPYRLFHKAFLLACPKFRAPCVAKRRPNDTWNQMRHRETDNYVAVDKGRPLPRNLQSYCRRVRGLVKPTGWCNTRHESVRVGARVKKAPDVREPMFFLLSSTMQSPRCHILSILSTGDDDTPLILVSE